MIKYFSIRILSAFLLICSLFLGCGINAYAQSIDPARLQQFEEAILRGEEFLQAKDYARAKAEYQKALNIDPSAKFPKDKLAQIRKVYTDPEDEVRFTNAVEQGNRLMLAKNFDAAKDQFSIAVNIKPEDKTIRDKLAEAERLAKERQEMVNQYEKIVAEADKLYTSGNLQAAREKYAEASALNPEENHPKQRIRDIDNNLASEKAKQELYEKLLTEADEAYMNRDFTTAKLKYEQALKIKPADNYPKSMLSRVAEGMTQQKDALAKYQTLIASADRLFQAGDYETALTAYQQASGIMSSEEYPKTRIAEINGILQQQKELEENYNDAITRGDALILEKKYEEARAIFQQAATLKPTETYPKQKIEEIAGLTAALKEAEINQSYQEAISKADNFFTIPDYPSALDAYGQAKKIKPAENYPDQQISRINDILTKEKADQQAYSNVIAEGDQLFNAGNYTGAKEKYNQALNIKPGEAYPASQISKADQQLALQKEKDDLYLKTVSEADRLYAEKNVNNALTEYNKAALLKPEEVYPKEQIAKLQTELDNLRSAEEKYKNYIAEGDRLYDNRDLQNSANAYNNALAIRPGEKYPSERIARIGQEMENQRIQRENYSTEIAKADQMFSDGKYEEARTTYTRAAGILPGENYPPEQIAKIEKIIRDRESLEENYAAYISEGDAAFANKQYQAARSSYQQALMLKPGEKYPTDRIALTDKELETAMQLSAGYQKAIAEGDILFNSGSLGEARDKYAGALKLQPGETYPAIQIERIAQMQAEQLANEQKFSKAIEDGDRLFSAGEYRQAQTHYNAALMIKQDAAHPAGRIAEIAKILGEQEATDKQYADAIQLGDNMLSQNKLDEAASAYLQAGQLKPSETYPGSQLELIEGRREAEKALNENYANAIITADAAFESKDYSQALASYRKALELKPGSEYPSAKIREINGIQEEQKMLADREYYEAIRQADQLFSEEDYTSAVKFYENASALKPGEKHPQDRILAIRTILQERTLNQLATYNKHIINADRLYQDKIFDQAIDAYLAASIARPDETYPGEMIGKIRKYLEDHAMVDLISDPTIIDADTEKRFSFNPIEMRLRKNNYVSIKGRKTSEADPKVYVNYGKGNQKNGGIVIRSITTEENGDYLVRVSIQDKWYREDNNWIAIYAEGGSIEISKMQIAQGD
ncbi:protein containing tetratricopeptide repeat [Lentimicrobium saccharophilum]|uniref:Outer dynein arm-docking complex subunit 4 n=1 Tax=Lentimicrobium saccharophilum TaxID=1678841 RepID=A0A0S7BYH5_9BACT|nr:hypothetical protein [Lentimicrobium saccharophilum]GAP42705.1 protein containing tetratricopeptide repeat [Lentimicrobium saccharophilum]